MLIFLKVKIILWCVGDFCEDIWFLGEEYYIFFLVRVCFKEIYLDVSLLIYGGSGGLRIIGDR